MMEKIAKYKKKILGVIGVLLTLTMFIGIKYLMKPKYEELPEVKLRDIKSNKSFAIMIQNGDSYEEYTSEDNTWPGADYVFKEAKCIDNNGALVDDAVTFTDGKATLTTNQTIYCTLYFDEKPKSTLEILREKDKEVSGGVEHLSPEPNLQGGMYRYQGTDDVPNWICFGTRDADTCKSDPDGIDKYMYRIIGITEEGQLYLLKETFLKEGLVTDFAWNSKWLISDCLGETCEWPNVDLYKRLNGTGNTIGKSNIFVNSTQYDYIKSGDENGTNDGKGSEWYQLIADHNWMYGDIDEYETTNPYNSDYMYAIETGKTTANRFWPDEETQTTCSDDSLCEEEEYSWSKKLIAKIGLMYMHDVDYAFTGGNPGSYPNVKNSWIHFQKDGYNTSSTNEWLITRFGVHYQNSANVLARIVFNDGSLGGDHLNYLFGARPVFYLKSNAKITSGDGTKDSPFILE